MAVLGMDLLETGCNKLEGSPRLGVEVDTSIRPEGDTDGSIRLVGEEDTSNRLDEGVESSTSKGGEEDAMVVSTKSERWYNNIKQSDMILLYHPNKGNIICYKV